jgi:hypothetical protein
VRRRYWRRWRFYLRPPEVGQVWTMAAFYIVLATGWHFVTGKTNWGYIAVMAVTSLVSLPVGTLPAGGSVIPHRPVNLLPGHGASMSMKEPGTRTPETGTTAVFSSWQELGRALTGGYVPTSQPRASSFTEPSSSGRGTGTPGGSGGQREGAG